MSKFSLDDFLPYQLAVMASHVSKEFSNIYAEKFGLSVSEWRVVVHLHNAGPVSVREIQARVDMDKSKVSRAASRLEKNGYITKETNSDDRRLLKLALTHKGRALMGEILPIALKFDTDLTEQLGADAAEFRRILTQFLKVQQ